MSQCCIINASVFIHKQAMCSFKSPGQNEKGYQSSPFFFPVAGEEVIRRRKSQNMSDQKYATIARGNRDARSEPRESIAPPMVPRSSTDHNIHFNNYSHSSPSHPGHHSPRYSAGYSPISERGSISSGGSGNFPRPQWEPSSGGEEPLGNLPLYAREARAPPPYSLNRENRHVIYRGPMFQHSRPKKGSGDISAPSLRESSV